MSALTLPMRLKAAFKHVQVPDPDVYQIDGALHMHPETLLRFEREVARHSRASA